MSERVVEALDVVRFSGQFPKGFVLCSGNDTDIDHILVRINSILKFFQIDIAGMLRMTSSARYFKEGVGSRRPS